MQGSARRRHRSDRWHLSSHGHYRGGGGSSKCSSSDVRNPLGAKSSSSHACMGGGRFRPDDAASSSSRSVGHGAVSQLHATSRSEREAASMHAERSKEMVYGGQGASCYSCADAVTQKYPKAGHGGFRALAARRCCCPTLRLLLRCWKHCTETVLLPPACVRYGVAALFAPRLLLHPD